MRARLRLLVVAVILVVLGAGGVLLTRSFLSQRKADLSRRVLDLLPEVAQRIVDFRRLKVDDGRKVWEVSAREARYFDDEQLVSVEEPSVMIFLEDGRILKLRGKQGKIFLGGQDLQRVEIDGDIGVEIGEYALRSDHASYEREQDVVVVPGRVSITGAGIEVHGENLRLEVKAQRLHLSQDVKMTWRPVS